MNTSALAIFEPFSVVGVALQVSPFDQRFRRMSKVLIGSTNSGAGQSPAAWDKYPPCFQLRRRFCDGLRLGMSRRIRALGELRPEWEMDNFFCSHRCTSSVRLWLGARSVLTAPARPAYLLPSSFGLLASLSI